MDTNLQKSQEINKNELIHANNENILINAEPKTGELINGEHESVKKVSEVQEVVPRKKIKTKPLSEKQRLIRNEKKSKNYATLGISFDLKGVSVNDADSPKMVALKEALHDYLDIKEQILKTEQIRQEADQEAENSREIKLIYSAKQRAENELYNRVAKRMSGIGEDHEKELGAAYKRVYRALTEYTAGKCIWFKWGRGRARLKQVKAVADMLQADNRQFGLSEVRHDIYTSFDNYAHDDWNVAPNYLGLLRNKDRIDKRHEKLRKEGRNNSLHLGWYGALAKDFGNVLLGSWHLAGGTLVRTLAVPTMIAANALELTGKVAKLGLKGLSMIVNGGLKLFRSKKRWRIRVDRHTLSKGWTSLNRARKLNLYAFKHTFVLGLYTGIYVPIHTVCRAIKNIWRDEYEKKRVRDILKDDYGWLVDNVKRLSARELSLLKHAVGTTKDLYGEASKEMAENLIIENQDEELDDNYDDDDDDGAQEA